MKDPKKDCRSPVANEAVADLHKALKKEIEDSNGYGAATSTSGGCTSGGRSRSLETSRRGSEEAKLLKEPGGFRRNFLNEKAEASGVSEDRRPPQWKQTLMNRVRPLGRTGQFDSVMGMKMDPKTGREVPAAEGSCGLTPTALAIVKSFVGSGITFMPGAFSHGGWLFSSIVLMIIACVNAMCIQKLVQCQDKQANPRASFACIADSACGWVGRLSVQVSLVISQFGVCIAYIIFITRLVHSIGNVSDGMIMCVLFPVLVPLCLIRSVDNLEYPNLVADALILFGLVVVIVHGCITMATTDAIDSFIESVHTDELRLQSKMAADPNYHPVVPFRPETCGIFIGVAIFTFEGIPMVLPIRNAMAKQEQFIPLFLAVFSGIALLFGLFGMIGYISYKDKVETVVLLNLPDSGLTIAVKFGYMLALCFSTPLMFLPAARITELWVLGASEDDPDKDGDRVWLINAMRTFEVLVFCLVAVLFGAHFSRFLAFIGALCCAPVAFVYPSLFHLVLCARTTAAKAIDVALLTFGLFAMGFALVSAI